MKIIYLFVIIFTILSCSDDAPKAIEVVLEDVENGAVLRTISIQNAEFDINDPTSEFNVLLEEQDRENGELLERIEVRLSFIDNSADNGDQSVQSFLLEELRPDDFDFSSFNLPRINLKYTFESLLNASGLDIDNVGCKDQFKIDLTLLLSNGLIFNTANSAGTVVNKSGFFASPFTYIINVVEPIQSSRFTGVYFMETLEARGNGIPFGIESGLVEFRQGHSNNTRIFKPLSTGVETLETEITLACDRAIATRYQKTVLPTCRIQLDLSDRVLLGPDDPPGFVDEFNDSVFELYILEGYQGYSVQCGYSDIPSKYRFTKQ